MTVFELWFEVASKYFHGSVDGDYFCGLECVSHHQKIVFRYIPMDEHAILRLREWLDNTGNLRKNRQFPKTKEISLQIVNLLPTKYQDNVRVVEEVYYEDIPGHPDGIQMPNLLIHMFLYPD
jgi:hypothetical protein